MNLSPFGKNDRELLIVKSFKKLLTAVIICYQKSLENEHLESSENYIRNMLVDEYLEDSLIKEELGIMEFDFTAEAAVIKDRKEIGYLDIKIVVKNHSLSNIKNSFFVFECKNLDGESALNSQYIQEGIHRFVNEKYPTTLGRNGMLGFIIKPIDIEGNTQKINNLLNKSGTNAEIVAVRKQTKEHLKKYTIVNNFVFSYCSKHETLTDKKSFELYHLMLDYSDNIR